ncbi:MAG: hypothetical protein ACFFDT_10305, partial [Candidatus Hodarchaeota archaeon]
MTRKSIVLSSTLFLSLFLFISILASAPNAEIKAKTPENSTVNRIPPIYPTIYNPYATPGETITYVVSDLTFDMNSILAEMIPPDSGITTATVTGDFLNSEIKIKTLRADAEHYQIAAQAVLGQDITISVSGELPPEMPPTLAEGTIPAGTAIPIPISLPGMFFSLGSLIGGEYFPDLLSARGSYYFDRTVMDGMPLFLAENDWATHTFLFNDFGELLYNGTDGSVTGVAYDDGTTFTFEFSGYNPDNPNLNNGTIYFNWNMTDCLLDSIDVDMYQDINNDSMISSWEHFEVMIERTGRELRPPEVALGDTFTYGTGPVTVSLSGEGDLWDHLTEKMTPENYADWATFYADLQSFITSYSNQELFRFDVVGVDGCYIQTDMWMYNDSTDLLEPVVDMPFPVGWDAYHRLPVFNVTGATILDYLEIYQLPGYEKDNGTRAIQENGDYEGPNMGGLYRDVEFAYISTGLDVDLLFVDEWGHIYRIVDYNTSAVWDPVPLYFEDGWQAQTSHYSVLEPINWDNDVYADLLLADPGNTHRLDVWNDTDGDGNYSYGATLLNLEGWDAGEYNNEYWSAEITDVLVTDYNNDGYDDLIVASNYQGPIQYHGYYDEDIDEWVETEPYWDWGNHHQLETYRYNSFNGQYEYDSHLDGFGDWNPTLDMEITDFQGNPMLLVVNAEEDGFHLYTYTSEGWWSQDWYSLNRGDFLSSGAFGDFDGEADGTDLVLTAGEEGRLYYYYDLYNHSEWIEGYWDDWGNWINPHWAWWPRFQEEETYGASFYINEVYTDWNTGNVHGLIEQKQLFADEEFYAVEIVFGTLDEKTYVPVVFMMGDDGGSSLPFFSNGDKRSLQENGDENDGGGFMQMLPIIMTLGQLAPVATPDYDIQMGLMNFLETSVFTEITQALGWEGLREQLIGENGTTYIGFDGDAAFNIEPNPQSYVSMSANVYLQELVHVPWDPSVAYDGPQHINITLQELAWESWAQNGTFDGIHVQLDAFGEAAIIPEDNDTTTPPELVQGTVSLTIDATLARIVNGIPITIPPPTGAVMLPIPMAPVPPFNPPPPIPAPSLTYPTDGVTVARGISVNNDPVNDDGTVLATVATADDPTVGGMVIGEWPAGSTMNHSGG